MVFGSEDLLRTRIAAAPDPMWELVLGMYRARDVTLPPPTPDWRRELAGRLAGAGPAGRRSVAVLGTLISPAGSFPDFLTPPLAGEGLDGASEAIVATPRVRLRADLSAVFAKQAAPSWVHALAGGDRGALLQMVAAVRATHDLLVAPHWPAITRVVAADRDARLRMVGEHGIGHALGTLPGVLGWDGETLTVRYPEDRTVRLRGRGLMLVPSYFCWGNPVTFIDPELPPVLVYAATRHGGQVGQDGQIGQDGQDDGRPEYPGGVSPALVGLLNRTRADCLHALTSPHTTTELARRLAASIGTASKQAAVLRDCGLITSTRRGNTVIHHITPLGSALLAGKLPAALNAMNSML